MDQQDQTLALYLLTRWLNAYKPYEQYVVEQDTRTFLTRLKAEAEPHGKLETFLNFIGRKRAR